jgi:exopolysaccharide transport family protein
MQKMLLPHEVDGHEAPAEIGNEGGIGLSLVDLLRIVRVRRKIILGTALAVIALTIVTVLQLTPVYTATAVVMLDQRRNTVADTNAVLSDLGSDQATVQNQVQILTSLELAQRVTKKLHLETNPSFNPSLTIFGMVRKYVNPFNWFPGTAATVAASNGLDPITSRVVHQLSDNLVVSPIGLSTAISVAYKSPDAVQAALIANTFADAYVEDQLEAKFDATRKATQWLTGRIQELSQQAQTADAAVQRYKADHNINPTQMGSTIVEQQAAAISGQLVLAKADLAEKQARYNSLLDLQKSGHAADSASVLASPLISNLRAQESELNRQLADLGSRYLPSHPKILNLQAQRDNLESKIDQEVQRVVGAVHADVSAASAHVASLQGSLTTAEGQSAGQGVSSVQLTALQSTATATRSMYEAFLGRLNQAQGQEGIQAPDARTISNAETPSTPSFPKTFLFVALSVPAGLMLGFVLAFMAERLDSGFRTAAQVEALFGLPVIATVPELKAASGTAANAADTVIDNPMSSFSEAIRGLQLGLTLAHIDQQPKVVVVTSSVPGEGKTILAISLARVAARGGLKVVIVDGDLRRPNVLTAMGIAAPAAGLIEALTGKMPLDQCLVRDEKSGALILPCIKSPPNPADLLLSKAMQNLLASLRESFDLVVIDSAPVLPVHDAKILSRMCDALLFVTRWEKTPRDAAANAIRALADVHAPISGIALARADSERFQYYSYGYQSYHGYNKYYSG